MLRRLLIRISITMTRRLYLWVVGLLIVGSVVSSAGATDTLTDEMTANSRIDVVAHLARSDMETRLRELIADWTAGDPKSVVERSSLKGFGEVVSTVTYRPRSEDVRLTADAQKNTVTVSLPIDINSRHRIDGTAGAVIESRGCGRGRFILKARYKMRIEQSRFEVSEQRVWMSDGGYDCVIGARGAARLITDGIRLLKRDAVTEVNVTDKLRSAVKEKARDLTARASDQLAAWLMDHEHMRQLAARPVVFGGAIALGLDFTGFTPIRVGIDTDDFVLEGELRGQPRIHFGSDWPQIDSPLSDATSSNSEVKDFSLSLKALFPRDSALLPAVAYDQPGRHPNSLFRIRAIPGRDDLVVLQHKSKSDVENLIWLSGTGTMPEREPVVFQRPMRDVFRELVCWLNREDLWRDVSGINRLRQRVREVRSALSKFEQETRLPLDQRGELVFSELSVDLRRAWVTEQAIWADIVLRGKARLEIRYAIRSI